MAFCPNCGSKIEDGAAFCPNCGASAGAPGTAPVVPAFDPNDHTNEFDPKDISDNKVIAMAPYLLGTVGIIIALLAARDSKYAAFHSRQALKLDLVTILLGIVSALLCWTFIVPIAGLVCIVIVFVVRIIGFFNVCSGKAKDLPIIRSMGFLK